MPLKITLDTNVVVEYWKEQEKWDVVGALIDLSDTGEIELAVTSRIHEDIPDPPLADKINELAQMGVVKSGSVTRLGSWRLGSDQLADSDFTEFSTKVAEMAATSVERVPDWRDWDHLHGHYLQQRDVFLTWDRGVLAIRDTLLSEFGMVVATPEDFLQRFANGEWSSSP